MKWYWKVCIGILLTLIIFIIVDCSSGITRYLECYVDRHRYVPSWTEVHVSTDNKGNTSTWIENHPEEYHLICIEHQTYINIDVNSGQYLYMILTNQSEVTVKVRQGRYLKLYYLPQIIQP